MTILQMTDSREVKEKRFNELIQLAKTEKRELTETEQNELDTLETEVEDLKNKIDERKAELAKLAQIQTRTNKPVQKNQRKKNYGLINAINDVIDNNNKSDELIEFNERGKNEFSNSGIASKGHIVLSVGEERAISAGTATKGLEDISEDKLAIVQALRNRSVLIQAGAQYLTGLKGDISIPIYSGSNVGWAAETAAAAAGDGLFSEVILKPLRLTAFIDISKQFLIQDTNSAEAMLMGDLVKAINEKLESTLLGAAAGSATTPAGIANLIAPVTLTPDWAEIVALEAKLETNKVTNNIKYLVNPALKAILKTTSKDTGSGLFIWDKEGIDGNVALSSGNVFASGLVVGDWEDYIVAQWGGIDITVDNVSQAINGNVRLVVSSFWNGAPRRKTSFVTADV
jgi:HK97 family phage major capsid protein